MTETPITITLLHSNDLHSHFEETSRIAAYVNDIRRTIEPERLVLVDCGDFLDRVRIETEGTSGAVNRAVLERIGYDAVLLGNNEGLSYTPEQLDSLFLGMAMPVVCANMVLTGTGDCPPWMVPTLTLVRSGIRIGLVGVTAPFSDYYSLLGWTALDPIERIRSEVERLRRESDIVIVLSHLGLRQDERIAASIDGIDLILGGHTHHLLEVPLRVGSTTIGAAGKFGSHLGHLELKFGPGNKLLSTNGGAISMNGHATLPDLDVIVRRYREEARRLMNREIALLREPLAIEPFEESALGNLLACSVRYATSAEIGLVNAGQLLQGLPEGIVTEETVHAICPSPINACVIQLRGDRIIRALEESLLPEFQQLEIRGFGFRGRVLGILCLDGLEVSADLGRAPYDRIVSAKVNGEPLDEAKIYSVGTLDMFTFGIGYVSLKEGQDVRYFVPEFIRDLLAEALTVENWLRDCHRNRWSFNS
jgi:5'-nucleotidase